VTDTVGSAAEEAAKLIAAVQDWARTRFDTEHVAAGGSECQICPVCQGIAALRQVRPEAVEHLLDAAASVVAALRVTATAHPVPPDGPRVQHIDVREG
jgi:hypothetical protein